MPFILVALGGSIGAISRYALGLWVTTKFPTAFPLATFIINVTGSFFLGVVMTVVTLRLTEHTEALRLVVGVGFLGAYTTFSTFEYETSSLLEEGAIMLTSLYVASSVIVGFVGMRLGLILARALG